MKLWARFGLGTDDMVVARDFGDVSSGVSSFPVVSLTGFEPRVPAQ